MSPVTPPAASSGPRSFDGRSLLLVHAHPDDESIGTGATMAKYAAQGARVTLVTCTLGELGEILPPRLAHLAADRDDRLGEYRIGELDAACAALGVTDHRFLGGAGRWRDSGMIGTAGNEDPRCFWRADTGEAVAALLAVIEEVRPQVLVSYDDNGGYGHPDHIQAHRVTRRAFELAAAGSAAAGSGGAPPVAKLYATARLGNPQATTEIGASDYLPAKLAAMRAHATQLTVEGSHFYLTNLINRPVFGRESYTLLAGPRGPGTAAGELEHDLFAGLG
ncbi:MAG TPA: N-acetyl-1-D-myo-inositol-2-amino-2-deoxy-alpha-D-glucopyranoside deacetylase [Streptosporangiaceae bacterium]|jgi:N-acetyl-1-D-myo-inositol-2-amino-2-deoxy-alpha-D-glucopyranoside deacetylase|nr:N-acetyl-1-D-myo-inositol-2-amino-2-deoxy-alpha-D-glucopyranoside deacetylase [Streptosporangiaceae bacterium]